MQTKVLVCATLLFILAGSCSAAPINRVLYGPAGVVPTRQLNAASGTASNISISSTGVLWFKKLWTGMAYSVKRTLDGNYIVVGWNETIHKWSVTVNATIAKLDSNGNIIWMKKLWNGWAYSLQPTSGGYVVAGCNRSTVLNATATIAKLDSNGNIIWMKKLWNGCIVKLQQTPNGYVAAGYTTTHTFLVVNATIAKLDSNGNIIWMKKLWNGPIISVFLTSDGNYIVVGYEGTIVPNATATIAKLDSNGNIIWMKKLWNGCAYSLQPTSGGNYLVVGCISNPAILALNATIAKLDSNGNIIWMKKLWNGWAHSLQSTSGGYVVAGCNFSTLPNVTATIAKLDSNGNIIWMKKLWNGWAYSLQPTSDGYVVAGCNRSTVPIAVVAKVPSAKPLQTSVSFSPSNTTLPPNSTTTLNLLIDKLPTGFSYTNITLTVTNPSTAEITGIKFPTWASLHTNTTLPSSTLTFTEGDLSNAVKAGQTNVTLATITIKALKPGVTEITVKVNSFQDDNYKEISSSVTALPATITVVTGPPPIDGHTPKDLNHDGLYEDVNGDGHFNFGDVVFFFDHLSEIMSNPAYTKYLDFNHDGTVNFGDVVALFNMLSKM